MSIRKSLLLGLALCLAGASTGSTVTAESQTAKPYVVEYYYKVKWGHFDEFKALYIKNHYPLLLREQKLGRIVSMNAAYPVYHAGETSRWDMRFTIAWKDTATANDDFDPSAIVKELYPDQERFKTEERRRFELLLEHMDVPVAVDTLADWPKR